MACLMFALTLGGILVGALLRRALPKHTISAKTPRMWRGSVSA
jgi:hypothetical protein